MYNLDSTCNENIENFINKHNIFNKILEHLSFIPCFPIILLINKDYLPKNYY
jgi:hypothetical protein